MTVLAVADEAEDDSFVSSTLGVTGVVLDGATAALTAATMVVAVFVFISVVTGLDSVAAGSDAPQEKQNLLPGGFDDLHEEHWPSLAAAVCVGAVSTLPHAEQNRFPGGLPAPQAGHNESGWPAMKAPWAEPASKFMENYILAGIEVKQPNHEFFLQDQFL